MTKNSSNSGTIKSVDATFAIFEFLQMHGEAGVTEIAEYLGKSKSTVHGHLSSMVSAGYAAKYGTTYRLGLRFLDIGTHVRDNLVIVDAAKPKMEELATETGEVVWCLVEEGGMGYWVDQAAGTRPVHTGIRIGGRSHLHFHAAGKAVLAFQSDERISEIIDAHGLPQRTEQTITDPEVLRDELEAIRERRYAINEEESVRGLRAVAAPIRFPTGVVNAALCVAGPKHRLKGEMFRTELPDRVLGTANEIEISLQNWSNSSHSRVR